MDIVQYKKAYNVLTDRLVITFLLYLRANNPNPKMVKVIDIQRNLQLTDWQINDLIKKTQELGLVKQEDGLVLLTPEGRHVANELAHLSKTPA